MNGPSFSFVGGFADDPELRELARETLEVFEEGGCEGLVFEELLTEPEGPKALRREIAEELSNAVFFALDEGASWEQILEIVQGELDQWGPQ